MSDFINLSCPSCGGKIIQQDNQFVCENCQSQFLMRQDGNRINLIPQVVVNVHTGQGDGSHTANKSERVKCPICGRNVDLGNTFQCKRCGRENICLTHQDTRTFFCSECDSELTKRKNSERAVTKKETNRKRILPLISSVSGLFACLSVILWYYEPGIFGQSDWNRVTEILSYAFFWLHLIIGIVSVIFGFIIVKRYKKQGQFAILAPVLIFILVIIVEIMING